MALLQAMGGEVVLSHADLVAATGAVECAPDEETLTLTYRLIEAAPELIPHTPDSSLPTSATDVHLKKMGFSPSRKGWMVAGVAPNTYVNKGNGPILLYADSMDPNETQLLNPGDIVVIKPPRPQPGGVYKRQPGEDLYRNTRNSHVWVEDYDGERTILSPGMTYSFTEKRGYTQ